MISLEASKKKPKSSTRHIEEFEKSFVWEDIQDLIKSRLLLNYGDLLDKNIGLEELKLLQGSSGEMHVFLRLPEMLKDGIKFYKEEELKQIKSKEENSK